MSSIRPLLPLYITIGILLGGNGLQGTLIALRGAQEGFSPATIGFFGTAYFAGFLIGCLTVARMLRAVGHIRVFATLAALVASGSLMLVILIDPVNWAIIRFLSGICFAGLFTTVESWLNAGSTNENRGRVLALYRIVDIASVVGTQYVMAATGTGGFLIFAIMAMMFALSLVPVSMGDRSNPRPPSDMRVDLSGVWAISPLACFGCAAIGMTNSAFRTVAPVYGELIGFSVTQVVTFMSAGIVGGVVMQYPLGLLSDRWDRRWVIMATATGAMLSAFAIMLFAGQDALRNFVLILAFGSFAMPLYALSVAHANDFAREDQYVKLAAGLLFFYSVGAVIGPLLASAVMQKFGPPALFGVSGAIYFVLISVILMRMRARKPVPSAMRTRFMPLLRTSPLFIRLARKAEVKTTKPHDKSTDVAK
ncbi:MAG: MFS transporter [Rhizobiaceae bacterium]